jgi:hypothetical protein
MHYLSSVYSVTIPLLVSSFLVIIIIIIIIIYLTASGLSPGGSDYAYT